MILIPQIRWCNAHFIRRAASSQRWPFCGPKVSTYCCVAGRFLNIVWRSPQKGHKWKRGQGWADNHSAWSVGLLINVLAQSSNSEDTGQSEEDGGWGKQHETRSHRLEEGWWRPCADQQERTPGMCNLTRPFSANIIAAPNQSKLSQPKRASWRKGILSRVRRFF